MPLRLSGPLHPKISLQSDVPRCQKVLPLCETPSTLALHWLVLPAILVSKHDTIRYDTIRYLPTYLHYLPSLPPTRFPRPPARLSTSGTD
ncbi:hypothetical protein LX32DRAFT_407345 [Colletotrichum zoysiae]|uniref:Uncharacterized protein n=1 Tax=Colletotrichum zoysiae TaxID=1216348 RepID=A0AAD9M4E7_9PEZI|nr:hypothetical protein LX32DRAFT_407345 [Colletotrichum zoysiae]